MKTLMALLGWMLFVIVMASAADYLNHKACAGTKVDAGVTELEFIDGGLVEVPDFKTIAALRAALAIKLNDIADTVSKKTEEKWEIGLVQCEAPATTEDDTCIVVLMNKDGKMFSMVFIRHGRNWAVSPKIFR